MIFIIIITAVMSGLIAIFTLIPDLPPTPEYLVAFSDLFANVLRQFSGAFRYFMTPSLALFSITLVIAFLGFEPIYRVTMWILRKIPMIGIK